jgi:hydroxymethylpyrimidine pyrophosphatase-like HAD family hydrolase
LGVVILADVDGTLIEGGGKVLSSASPLIKVITELNALVVPVSARPVDALARLFKPFTGVTYAIGSGGGVAAGISQGRVGRILHEKTMDLSLGAELIDAFLRWRDQERGSVWIFCSSRALFRVIESSRHGRLSAEQKAIICGSRPFQPAAGTSFHEDLHDLRPLGISFLAAGEPAGIQRLLRGVPVPASWRIAVYPELRVPGWTWVEAFPHAANKAQTCDWLLTAILDVQRGSVPVIALGDSAEDVGMFRLADLSYCPRGSAQQAIDAATALVDAPAGEPFVSEVAQLLLDELVRRE